MSVVLPKPGLKRAMAAAVGYSQNGRPLVKKDAGSVVSLCVAGRTQIGTSHLINQILSGLPVQELKDLQVSLDVPMEKRVPMLGISNATLHRRMAGGRLGPVESDRVVRFARLMGKAVEVMESAENARQWLTSPQFGLGGAVPLEYAETEVGAREVEDLLGRIEYGVYS
jgi:putative toxin-antitoxin system antitoxin component (TIGR02293 family)